MLRWPMEAEIRRKIFKTRAKFKERTASDVCRLCRNNLKQKFGDFSKNSCITAVNVFKPWTRGGRQNAPFAELCKRIGLDIEKATTSSERVCNVCARNTRLPILLATCAAFCTRVRDSEVRAGTHSRRLRRLIIWLQTDLQFAKSIIY